MATVRTLRAMVGAWAPLTLDAVLAVLVAVIAIAVSVVNASDGGLRWSPLPDGVTLGLVIFALVLAATALALRRRAPTLVLAVAVAAHVVEAGLMPSQNAGWVSVWLSLYSCGAYLGRRRAALCWLLTSGVFALSGSAFGGAITADGGLAGTSMVLGGAVNNALVMGLITLLGAYVQSRRAYRAELVARAERLERDRERRVNEAIMNERLRIARELHDVAAHHLSGMVVQAGAAERLMVTNPEQARTLMSDIRVSGRETLASMRRLIGMLRAVDHAADEVPSRPRLQQLGELIAAAQAAGAAVQVSVEGEPRPLPDDVDLAACRIMQEALTNVRKHAPGSVARAYVRYRHRDVEIEVVDDGRASAAADAQRSPEPSGGVGLIGMRERVGVLGGEFRTGPRAQGGWQVCARLPLSDWEASRAEPAPLDWGAGQR